MPTDQPSSAPDATTPTPNDADTAARVLADDHVDTPPGGGALGGALASDPPGGSGRTPGGASPNSPIDTGVSGDTEVTTEAAARAEASRAGPTEPHPSSQ